MSVRTHRDGAWEFIYLGRILFIVSVFAFVGSRAPAGEMATPVASASPAALDVGWLLRINEAVLLAVRMQALPPPLVARNLAILHLAIEEAWRRGGADRIACATAAAEIVGESLFPGWQSGESLHAASAATLAAAEVAARRLGQGIGEQWLAQRGDDETNCFVNYQPSDDAGRWRRTFPFYRPPELPNWSLVRPFAIDLTKFIWPGPPALNSAAWAEARDELVAKGGKVSAQRTAEEEQIARFWSDFSYTCTPPGHWNVIAADVVRQESLSAEQAVRLFALLNVAMADAGISGWEAKYRYDFWRPVTAINPVADPAGWLPLLTTPAHPEYPSGHSFFSGAAAEVLAAVLGRDNCELTVASDALPDVTRRFASFSAVAVEVSRSRVYSGIHYRFSCQDGLSVGREIGREVLREDSLRRQGEPQNDSIPRARASLRPDSLSPLASADGSAAKAGSPVDHPALRRQSRPAVQ